MPARTLLMAQPAAGGGGGYESAVLDDSPSRYWRYEETSGTTVTDEIAAVSGTVSGGGDLSGSTGNGALGGAISLDGTDDLVESTTALTTLPWTIEAWVKTGTDGGTIYAEADTTDVRNRSYVQLGLLSGAAFAVSRTDAAVQRVVGTSTITDNVTHHVVAVFQTDHTVDLYVDGALEQSGSTGNGNAPTLPYSNGVTGGLVRKSGASDYLAGVIDEVALYDGTALSSARISAHYTAGTA